MFLKISLVCIFDRSCSSADLLPIRNDAYIDCLDADGDGYDIASAITGFADDCKSTLALEFWPAENTCSEFENAFNLFPYMNEVCLPRCKFGGRIGSTSKCVCDNGYWGVSCEQICPGGASVPCSGFGTCNQTTGKCNCPLNRQMADNCSICSNEWQGENCTFAANVERSAKNKHIAIVGQLGSVYTFDGLSYAVKLQGELLLLSLSNNIIIQGKFVTCYQNYSCITFVSARLGNSSNGYVNITVQASKEYNSKPLLYINRISNTLDKTVFFSGFKLYRSSFFAVRIDVKNVANFTITTDGQFLHLDIELQKTLLNKTSGLLSGAAADSATDKLKHLHEISLTNFNICNSTSSIQTALASESSETMTLDPYTQTYADDFELSISRYFVSTCDSIFDYPSSEYRYQTQGGFGLSFIKSSIHHEFNINPSSVTKLTFEILVKQNLANDSGVLFSFTGETSLIILSGKMSIEVHTYNGNKTEYDTNLSLDQSQWNKVILTYDNREGIAIVFVIDNNAAVSTTGQFKLPPGIFNKTSLLTVGNWYAPSDGKTYQLPKGFNGKIENFLIWDIMILPNEISQLWKMDPAVPAESLLFSLQFNEGDGFLTKDNVANVEIAFPGYPWKAPEWFVSDLNYTGSYVPDFAYTYFINKSFENEADTICSNAIYNVECPGVSNSTKEFFFIICRQAMSATNLQKPGYSVILDYYQICINDHGMDNSLLASLCTGTTHEENIPTCSIGNCIYGFQQANGSCECFKGYYGKYCNAVCPGGSDTPCSNHGICLGNGTCQCWWNWNGNSECSACTSDNTGSVIGPDCAILKTTSLSSQSSIIAAVSSNGYYMTFNGQQISFTGETGVFQLFQSSILGVEVHVYQVPCNIGSCIKAISVSSSTNKAVVVPPRQDYAPLFYLDNSLKKLENIINTFGTMTVTYDSLDEISVKVTSIGSITVTVIAENEFLHASVITDSTVCQSGIGIFGACGTSGVNYTSMTQKDIAKYISTNFRLSASTIFDSLNITTVNNSYGSSYALKFNNTAVLSKPLEYQSDFKIADRDFSISLYFKPLEYGGCLISYAGNVSFAIINSNPMQLQYATSSVQLPFSAELNIWNQLVFTFRRSSKQIDVYHFGKASTIMHDIVKLDCPGIFERGGVIMLGAYLPSIQSKVYTYSSDVFIGFVDEITVWKDSIPDFLIYQAHLLNTKASNFISKLSILVSFYEGVGNVAFEKASGNNLKLPSYPWQAPTWTFSDLQLDVLQQFTEEHNTVYVNATITDSCSSFFDSIIIQQECTSVSDFIKLWYKETCKTTASNTGYLYNTAISMVDFVSICKVTGGNATRLYEEICSSKTNVPKWLTHKCSGCAFGYKSNGQCICYSGYFGDKCDSVCPGGTKTPCSGHGECDVNGICQCNGHFTGSICDTCDTDWFGEDCIIFKQLSYDPLRNGANILVAQVNLIGQITSFDGVMIDIPSAGYYNLISINSLDVSIYGRVSICSSDSALQICLFGIIIVHNDESYYISYKAYETTKIEITTSSSSLILYDTLVLNHITLKLESTATVKMTVVNSDLIMRMSVINEKMLTTISISRTEWNKRQAEISGILTSCNTSLAISAFRCNISRNSVCSDPAQTLPDNCKMPLTYETSDVFFKAFVYIDFTFIARIEGKFVQALKSNCLLYSGTGVSVSGITLPKSDFTIELHVKPTAFGGIILSYTFQNEYLILVHHTDGILLILRGIYHSTGILVELNVWNQISLAWREDSSILEVYHTNKEGKQDQNYFA